MRLRAIGADTCASAAVVVGALAGPGGALRSGPTVIGPTWLIWLAGRPAQSISLVFCRNSLPRLDELVFSLGLKGGSRLSRMLAPRFSSRVSECPGARRR